MKKDHIVCLYEQSGLSALPWALNGYKVFCYDIQHKERIVTYYPGGGSIQNIPWDARNKAENTAMVKRHAGETKLVLAYPPCTDLAVSGARHFAAKKEANPNYREEAMALVYVARSIAECLKAPYAIENPVSVISSEWRKPDHTFSPNNFGGYLPEADKHPLYPDIFPPQDAYLKKTCLWTGGGYIHPKPKNVKPIGGQVLFNKLGGKSQRTKNIRSTSPRGFAQAVYEANKDSQ